MTYVEVYMISRDNLIDIAKQFPATLRIIRRSAFRLAFRREMIRRAQENLDKLTAARDKAHGITSAPKDSAADRLMVAISSKEQPDFDSPADSGRPDQLPPIQGSAAA